MDTDDPRAQECEDLLSALTSEQKTHLLEHDYVWVKGVGVLWKATDGALRRARFTHRTHFRTPRGEFYIDSEGNVHERSHHPLDSPAPPPQTPSWEATLSKSGWLWGQCEEDSTTDPQHPAADEPLAAPRGTH